MAGLKVLAVDGGGIRGILPATWLQLLEIDLKARGASLADQFNVFAGTSTGAIIAAAMAIGKTPQDILDLYLVHGRTIFPPCWYAPLRSVRALVFQAKHKSKGIESVLKSVFGDATFGSITSPKTLLITAFDGGSRTLRVFDSRNPKDSTYLVRDVLQASCAAPTFLPAKQLTVGASKSPFLDGGVTANNPAALALTASGAKAIIDDVLLLSLGTGVSQAPITMSQCWRRGAIGWVLPLLEVMFDGSSSANEQLVEQLVAAGSYFRLQKRDLRTSSALDKASAKHLNQLKDEAQRYYTHERTLVQQLLAALVKPVASPALSIGGTWNSRYDWQQDGSDKVSDWTEVLELNVSKDRVSGRTVVSQHPYELEGRIFGRDIVGQTTSVDRDYKLHTSFVLRLNVENGRENELKGHWVGTSDTLLTGNWTLTRKDP